MMTSPDLHLDLDDLVSAEDFLDYFGIAYEPAIVQVNRLHIMQRFHDYLRADVLPADEAGQHALYTRLLSQAYRDFIDSDALTERVFKVLKAAVDDSPHEGFVPVDAVLRG